MLHFLSGLFKRLFGARHIETDPSSLTLEGLMDELGVEHYASKNGKLEKPPADADSPDEIERRIAKRISREKAAACRVWENRRSFAKNRMAVLQFRSGIAKIEAQIEEAVGAFERRAKRTVHDTYLFREDAEQQAVALENFKLKNKLTKPADIPETPILNVGIIAVVLLFEIVLNAYFFGKTDPMGPLGGFNYALTLAICNIGVTIFASALLLRQLFHRNILRKLFFGTIYAAILLFVFVLNVVFAKARDLMQDPALQSAFATTQRSLSAADLLAPSLRNAPQEISGNLSAVLLEQAKYLLTYEHFDTYLLLLSTCVFCLLAAYEVYKMDDPFPGFGKRTRAYRAARLLLEEKSKAGLNQLDKERDHHLKRTESIGNDVIADLKMQDSILVDSHEHDSVYFRTLQKLCSFEADLIREYRRLNSASRSSPPPPFFRSGIVREEPARPEPLTPVLDGRPALLEAFNEKMKAAASAIRKAYNEAAKEIETLKSPRNPSTPQSQWPHNQ